MIWDGSGGGLVGCGHCAITSPSSSSSSRLWCHHHHHHGSAWSLEPGRPGSWRPVGCSIVNWLIEKVFRGFSSANTWKLKIHTPGRGVLNTCSAFPKPLNTSKADASDYYWIFFNYLLNSNKPKCGHVINYRKTNDSWKIKLCSVIGCLITLLPEMIT